VRHTGDVKVDSGLAAAYSSSLVAAMRFRLRSGGSEQVRVNELTGVVVLDTALDRASLCPYADTCTIVVDVVVRPSQVPGSHRTLQLQCLRRSVHRVGRLGSRVVSILDSGAEGLEFKSQSRCCRVTVLGKLFTPIVPLFTKQQNW